MRKHVNAENEMSGVLLRNAVDTLVTNICFADADNPPRTLAITSAVPGEGKTTTAINLARALSARGRSALLVECNCQHRSLASNLGVSAHAGLYSVLLGRVSPGSAIAESSVRGLHVLDCEPAMPIPSNLLASAQFKSLVKKLRAAFGYVIFDTPSLLSCVDGAVVAAAADATLLIVREGRTRREDIDSSVKQLRQVGANVIGSVFCRCASEHALRVYERRNARERT